MLAPIDRPMVVSMMRPCRVRLVSFLLLGAFASSQSAMLCGIQCHSDRSHVLVPATFAHHHQGGAPAALGLPCHTSQVSNPALVDFKACMDATPEMKKAKDDKIDLDTPEGIKLTTEAVNRVTAACETTRIANSYCSVWKAIRHKDGHAVADITELVKAQL